MNNLNIRFRILIKTLFTLLIQLTAVFLTIKWIYILIQMRLYEKTSPVFILDCIWAVALGIIFNVALFISTTRTANKRKFFIIISMLPSIFISPLFFQSTLLAFAIIIAINIIAAINLIKN